MWKLLDNTYDALKLPVTVATTFRPRKRGFEYYSVTIFCYRVLIDRGLTTDQFPIK
jgi:hypothetical protein